MPDINPKDYENVHNINCGYGVDEKGKLCVILTLNGKHFILSTMGLKEIIVGLIEVQRKHDLDGDNNGRI